jgi:hypothetical protein
MSNRAGGLIGTNEQPWTNTVSAKAAPNTTCRTITRISTPLKTGIARIPKYSSVKNNLQTIAPSRHQRVGVLDRAH